MHSTKSASVERSMLTSAAACPPMHAGSMVSAKEIWRACRQLASRIHSEASREGLKCSALASCMYLTR